MEQVGAAPQTYLSQYLSLYNIYLRSLLHRLDHFHKLDQAYHQKVIGVAARRCKKLSILLARRAAHPYRYTHSDRHPHTSRFTLRQSLSTNILSSARPLPSMLIAIPSRLRTFVNDSPVNCAPWSLLKISGLPCIRNASSRQSTQNTASMLLLNRQLKIFRLYQSITAVR
jgi:hypothetical protein